MSQQLVSELVLEKEGVWSKLKNQSSPNVFFTLPSCRGRRYEFTGENPTKNRCPACPHAPTSADDSTAHAHPRAPRSPRVVLARLSATEPGWPATSSANQQPRQQFCTVISHVIYLGFDSVLRRHYFGLTRGFICTIYWPKTLTVKIWAIRSPIWVISVSFPIFLAVPDTSVSADLTDSNPRRIKKWRMK